MVEDVEPDLRVLVETARSSRDEAAVATASPSRPLILPRRALVTSAIFLAVLALFLTQTRLPATILKLQTADRAQTARGRVGFSQVVDPEAVPAGLRWLAYGANLWDANAIGMFFAMLLGGAAVGFAVPFTRMRRLLERRGALGAGVGGVMGVPLMMCSACSTPVSLGFYRSGASVETSLGVIIGSALFNPIGLIAMFAVLPPQMAVVRVAFGLVMLFVVAPLLARSFGRRSPVGVPGQCDLMKLPVEPAVDEPWRTAFIHGMRDWIRSSFDVAWRLGPLMLLATMVVGIIFALAPPQTFSDRIGSGVLAIVLTAAVGTLVQTPALFEVPLTLGLLFLGLAAGPATALLVTAPSAGLITLALVRRELGWRTPVLLLAATFGGGLAAGAIVSAL